MPPSVGELPDWVSKSEIARNSVIKTKPMLWTVLFCKSVPPVFLLCFVRLVCLATVLLFLTDERYLNDTCLDNA